MEGAEPAPNVGAALCAATAGTVTADGNATRVCGAKSPVHVSFAVRGACDLRLALDELGLRNEIPYGDGTAGFESADRAIGGKPLRTSGAQALAAGRAAQTPW
jgi:hypothetical protein